MSIFEYNEEEEMKKIRVAEYDYGWEMGHAKGMEVGEAKGRSEGKAEGKAEDILELLKELGQVPEAVSDRILQEKGLEILGLRSG